jgi:hypothetical protein
MDWRATFPILVVGLILEAQTTSTSIVGTVTDPTGAAIAQARVSARNVRTGVVTETVTTSTGDYAIPLLDVGEYEVTAEAPGFAAETRAGIRLQVNEKVRVDFRLKVGTLAERITVTSEAPAMR